MLDISAWWRVSIDLTGLNVGAVPRVSGREWHATRPTEKVLRH